MESEAGEADAGRAVAPRQHTGRFAGRSRLHETAQIGPIAFRRAKMGALVAQALRAQLRESRDVRSPRRGSPSA